MTPITHRHGSWLIALWAAVVILSSCKTDNMYTTWPCRFAYNNAEHLDATLNTALDINTPGIFCLITEGMKGQQKCLFFSNNYGLSSYQPETYLEQDAKYVLGLNNGIIVGHANALYNDFGNCQFVAYDQQCPNCVDATGDKINPVFRVIMSQSGIATCSKCGRKYNLNNGGIIMNAESENEKSLQRYRQASTTGPNGHIAVFR